MGKLKKERKPWRPRPFRHSLKGLIENKTAC